MSAREATSLSLELLSLELSSRRQGPTTSLYTDLNPARNEIRLLEILPRITDDAQEQIRCRLSVHSLDDKPSYTALSYVWGNPEKTKPVIVDDHEVSATINLVDALLQQREEGIRILWADALCIDQHHDSEKAQQIRTMGTIYRQAANVVAWLGQSDKTTERALLNITNIYEHVIRLDLETLREPRLFTWPEDDVHRAGSMLVQALSGDPAFHKGDLGLIMSFFEKPYWTRVWVIQELYLASAAQLCCGQYSIRWEVVEVTVAALSLVRFIAETETEQLTVSSLKSLCFPYNPESPTWEKTAAAHVSATLRARNDNSIPMWDLLDYTSNNTDLESLDPRDRIYALHGMLSEEDRGGFDVDLSVSWEELYVRITIHMLAQYGPKLFEFCGSTYQATPSLLPSWVVDWRCTQERESVNPWTVKRLSVPYRFKTPQQNMLTLKAALVGQIVEIIPFSGELADIPQVMDRLEHSIAVSAFPSRLPESRLHAWEGMVSGWRLSQSEVRQLDTFVDQVSRKEKLQDSVPQSGDKKRPYHELETTDESSLDDICRSAIQTVKKTTLVITDRGHIGSLDPGLEARTSDVIYAILEDVAPWVLRQAAEDDDFPVWVFLGGVRVPKIMRTYHELPVSPANMEELWDTNPPIEEITLV